MFHCVIVWKYTCLFVYFLKTTRKRAMILYAKLLFSILYMKKKKNCEFRK